MAAPVRRLLVASTTVAVTVALGGALAGCRKKDDASCDAVGARFMTFARTSLAARTDLDPATLRGITGLLAPMRDSIVRACREDGWSAPARACFGGAADVTAMRACEPELGASQRQRLHEAASGGIHATP